MNTSKYNSIYIPQVPLRNSIVINHVPSPHSSIIQGMGGTTPPSNSSYHTETPMYRKSPPHTQNTYTLKTSPNTNTLNKRECSTRYDTNQRTLAHECSRVGTDGLEYSRRETESVQRLGTDQTGINGNADWVRGNQFGVYYDDAKINNRTNYTTILPKQVQNRIQYLSTNPAYPLPKDRMWNTKSIWNKHYPEFRNTIQGKPFWNATN